MRTILLYVVLFLTVFNIVRLAIFLIGAEIYDMRQRDRQRKFEEEDGVESDENPFVTVLIPGYNEEGVITRCLESVILNDYENFRVIVIDDGSTDNTYKRIAEYIAKYRFGDRIHLLMQNNGGKGEALNHALRKYVEPGLVMVLDSDSFIAKDAIRKGVSYFNKHPKVVAASANIKIMPDNSLMGLVQEFEYIVSNRLRKTFNVLNAEYVIGGVGSMFRSSIIGEAGYYSDDTITEDLDLTFKILKLGNKKQRIGYAADVHAYTEAVLTFRELIKQRFRWRYGRYQAYLKHRNLLFSRSKKMDSRLTKLMLPYTILADIMFLAEPLMFMLIMAVAIVYGGLVTFVYGYVVVTVYVGIHLLLDNTTSLRRKALLASLSFAIYSFLTIASVVEYVALVKSVAKLPELKGTIKSGKGSWEHVTRSGEHVS